MPDIEYKHEPLSPTERLLFTNEKVGFWTDALIKAVNLNNVKELVFAANVLAYWVDARETIRKEIDGE